jgi:hypothetical protein
MPFSLLWTGCQWPALPQELHRVVVWLILADFDGLFAVVAAVGMWATILQRCPYVHGDIAPVIWRGR